MGSRQNTVTSPKPDDLDVATDYLFNFAVPLLSAFVSYRDPVAGIVAVGGFGAIQVGVQGLVRHLRSRVKEVVENVGPARITDLLEGAEQKKDTLLRTLHTVMVEESARRRAYYYNYLKNVYKYGMPPEDYTSKIAVVLSQITFSELDTLLLWDDHLVEAFMKKNAYTHSHAENYVKEHGLNETQVMFVYEGAKNPPSDEDVKRNIRALGRTYGLVDVIDTVGQIGPIDGVRVRWLTPFGEVFLKYLKDV